MITEKKATNKLIFIVLPLSVFLMGIGLHDVHGVLRLLGLVFGTFVLFLFTSKKLIARNKIQYLLWALVFGYLIIQLIVRNNIYQFLLGNYSRNGGFIALICFALIFNLVSNYKHSLGDVFIKTIIFTLYGLVIFGFLEKYSLLPFTIESKYEGAVALTLVNPNFASSYLAIALSTFIFSKLLSLNKKSMINAIIIILSIFIFFQTNSLQGYLLFVVNIFLFLLYKRKYIFKISRWLRMFLLSVSGVFLLFLTANILKIFSWVLENGSVTQRLNYWSLVIDIWRDHFLIGIGLESLRDYAPKYRTETLVRQEGIFTNPDRAHNVFLDHFVQGGLLVGLIWLFFVGTITFLAIKNLLSKSHSLSQTDFIIVVIWFSYVVQSAISVDHLALTLLGIISAALITKNNINSWVNLNSRKVSKTNNFSQLTLVSVFFLSCAIFLGQVIEFEYWARDITDRKNPKNLEKIYTSRIIVPQTLEDIAVEVSKTKNFEVANRFAIKLLTHRPSSHQGYYIKSVFFESKSDLELAKTNMLKALDLDPFNSVYLLSMAIYEYKSSNLDIAKDYFLRAQETNPNQEGLDIVSKYITY